MTSAAADLLRYSPGIEKPASDEAQTGAELSSVLQHITRTMAGRYRHAYRPVHAKSHGVIVGTLDVLPNLPPELAQGLFRAAASHPVVMRFSTNPGDLLADNVSTPRGLAMKVLDVEGTTFHGKPTQDFVCVNSYVFGAPDPKAFLGQLATFDKTLEMPEGVKHAVSVAARSANAVLKALHVPSATLEAVGASATHILGESFSTVAPIRFGDHVAKIDIVPGSPNLQALTGTSIDLGKHYNALTHLIEHFFASETGTWDVRAQLALASDDFPIEKADEEWPQDRSAYRKIATLTVTPQQTYSDARQLFVDEKLSFSPWHALEAHQPLGGIMRVRRKAYDEASDYRATRNQREHVEPTAIGVIPR